MIASLVIMLCFGAFIVLERSIVGIWALTIILGLFMGGVFNMLASLEIIKSSENDSTQVDMLSSLMAEANLAVGVTNLLAGLTLGSSQTLNIKAIFML